MSATGLGFDYRRPLSLDEALAAMAESETMAIAGGTDFVTLRNQGLIDPTVTVDLKHVDELTGMEVESDRIVLGACTTMAEVSGLKEPWVGALSDGAGVVGAVQTRYRATIGGNICRASPAGDTLPGLLVLEAVLTLEASGSSRLVPVAEFFKGPGETARQANEVLTKVELPLRGGASAYRRHTYRAWMDLAVVGVAVWVQADGEKCQAASVAIGGAAPTPLLVPRAAEALIGGYFEADRVAAAREAVLQAATPIDDVRGTSAHRKKALGVLTERMIESAWARARAATGSA